MGGVKMEFSFDLQMFGGGKGGSTTNVQAYEPSEYELELQKAQADYANAIAPNALWLNNVARGVLQDSLGTVQVDFNELNKQAQDRIYGYSDDMYGGIGDNNSQLSATNRYLDAVNGQIPGVTNDYVSGTNGIMSSNANAANATNDTLGDIAGAYGRNANQGNANIGGLVGQGDNALGDANSRLDQLLGKSEGALDKYSDVRDALIRGEIPAPYLQNMQDAIAGTMKRTAGEGLNALANRGIINSSVSEGVLNDIEKNATDAVTGRYLENINTINNLLGSQSGDALNLLGQQANLIGQRFGNTDTTLNRNYNIYNTQTANNANALGQQANLTQQQLGNISNANQQNAALLGQQYQNKMNGLTTQAGLANQALQNQLGTQKQNAATLDSLLGHANDNITTAAAAQEAAQQPAANLWNMSMGLNGQTTGALAAASGKGTTTSTTTQSGGGGLFSGLLGGLF